MAANEEMEKFSRNQKDVYRIVAQTDRELSNEIADKLRLKHKFPQIIILYKIKCTINIR